MSVDYAVGVGQRKIGNSFTKRFSDSESWETIATSGRQKRQSKRE